MVPAGSAASGRRAGRGGASPCDEWRGTGDCVGTRSTGTRCAMTADWTRCSPGADPPDQSDPLLRCSSPRNDPAARMSSEMYHSY